MFSCGITVTPSFVKIDNLIQKLEWERVQTTPWSYEPTSFASEEQTLAEQKSKCEVALIFPTSPIRTTLALPLCCLQKRCAVNGTPLHAALNCGNGIQHWHVTCHQWQWQVRTASLFTLVLDYAVEKKMRLPVHASDTWKDEYVAWWCIKHLCLLFSVSSPFQHLYNYSNLLRCYFMSTGKGLPTFSRAVPSPSAWSVQEESLDCSCSTVWAWRWRHHITSQRRYPLTPRTRLQSSSALLWQPQTSHAYNLCLGQPLSADKCLPYHVYKVGLKSNKTEHAARELAKL